MQIRVISSKQKNKVLLQKIILLQFMQGDRNQRQQQNFDIYIYFQVGLNNLDHET